MSAERPAGQAFPDADTASLYSTIAMFILPRLKRFKEMNGGYPANSTEEAWGADLDKMIRAFHLTTIEDEDGGLTEEQYAEIDAGLCVFAEHYRELWR